MNEEVRSRLDRSLEALDEEVENEEGVMDFLDSLDIIASNLAAYKLPNSRKAQSLSLGDLLVELARKSRNVKNLLEECKEIRQTINRLRKADYGDLDEYDLVELANELRAEVQRLLKKRFL